MANRYSVPVVQDCPAMWVVVAYPLLLFLKRATELFGQKVKSVESFLFFFHAFWDESTDRGTTTTTKPQAGLRKGKGRQFQPLMDVTIKARGAALWLHASGQRNQELQVTREVTGLLLRRTKCAKCA
jgi:hypothetical protein